MSTRKNPFASRASIFHRTNDGIPELTDQPDIETSSQLGTLPSQRAPTPELPRRIKRTFHLPPDVVLLLDELQVADHRRTGKKPELSALVSEAIRLLGERREVPV